MFFQHPLLLSWGDDWPHLGEHFNAIFLCSKVSTNHLFNKHKKSRFAVLFQKKSPLVFRAFSRVLTFTSRTWSRPSPCYAVPWRFRAGSLWGRRSFSWIIPRRMRSWRFPSWKGKHEAMKPRVLVLEPKFKRWEDDSSQFYWNQEIIFNEDPFGYRQLECVSGSTQWSSVDIDGYGVRFFVPKIFGMKKELGPQKL